MGQNPEPQVPFDPAVPNIARAYDYMLGGKDNFAADRELAGRILQLYPQAADLARENRAFLTHAVGHVAAAGIGQFIDVGAGLPTHPATHEAAREHQAGAHMVYVDIDPVVITHTLALLKADRVTAIAGDMTSPPQVLASAERTGLIDLTRPACVILAMVLHFLSAEQAANVVAGFTAALAPGSYLILSVGSNRDQDLAESVISEYSAGSLNVHTPAQIAGYFNGFDLVPPGLGDARTWRPGWDQVPADEKRRAFILAGVGRKRS